MSSKLYGFSRKNINANKHIYMMNYLIRLLVPAMAGLLFISLFNSGIAQPYHPCRSSNCREVSPDQTMLQYQFIGVPMGVPIGVVQSGHGFATRGNETHKIKIDVQALIPVDAMHIRKLLSSNTSLAEIRGEIRNRNGERAYRGSLMLDQTIYPLINIVVLPSKDNSSTIEAEIHSVKEEAVLGHLFIIITPFKDRNQGKGELKLDSAGISATYSLLLDMAPPGPERNCFHCSDDYSLERY